MSIEKLLREHRAILNAAAELETLVAGRHPGAFTPLALRRWTFTRDMLIHFAHVETRLLQPLMADRRPDAAAAAARSSLDLRRVYHRFQAHAERWQGLPSPEVWAAYGVAIDVMTQRLRDRLFEQERDIYSLLPILPGGVGIRVPGAPVNYAAEAWEIRKLIYREERAHLAA
jgi:hypothetical protein